MDARSQGAVISNQGEALPLRWLGIIFEVILGVKAGLNECREARQSFHLGNDDLLMAHECFKLSLGLVLSGSHCHR